MPLPFLRPDWTMKRQKINNRESSMEGSMLLFVFCNVLAM